MSAFDLLSKDERRRIHERDAADTQRFAELAALMLAEPRCIDRLAVYVMAKWRLPMRDDTETIRQLKVQLHAAFRALAAHGDNGADRG